MTELDELKKKYRAEFSKYRKGLSEELRRDWNINITARLISSEEYRTAQTVLIYCSSKYEVDTEAIIGNALSSGKKVAMPCSFPDGKMLFRYVKDPKKELQKGAFGIYEPSGDCIPVTEFDASICIIPGLVFDISGNRLGYGKGYYDRFLSGFAGAKIGLAYCGCIIESIPHDLFDVRLDKIISPDTEITFK